MDKYEILTDYHADDNGEYAATDLMEIRHIETGEVLDCCLTEEEVFEYFN